MPQIIALSLGVAHSCMNEQRKAAARGKIPSLSRCRKKTSHGVLFLVKCKSLNVRSTQFYSEHIQTYQFNKVITRIFLHISSKSVFLD